MLKENAPTVRMLLEKYPRTKDSDKVLVSQYWSLEMKVMGVDPYSISARTFLEMLSKGDFTGGESITRSRRKLQERYPELRGDSYKKRQEEKELEVRRETQENWDFANPDKEVDV